MNISQNAAYHDAKQRAARHNFKIGDVVYCANMKPNKLDPKFSFAKQVTKARDTFGIVNVDTGTTLVCTAKYLQHVPSDYVSDHTEQEVGTETKGSNDTGESSATVSDTCDNTAPSGHVDEQATQRKVVTARSGRVVKSTKDYDNFV